MYYRRNVFFVGILIISSLLLCVESQNNSVSSVPKKKLKILGIFPHPGKSHQDVFKPLLYELARRGHDLTVISYFPLRNNSESAESLLNYRDISLLNTEDEIFVNVVDLNAIRHIPIIMQINELLMLQEFAKISCRRLMRNPEVRRFVHTTKEKFDLILLENFNTDCAVSFVHKFRAPFIGLASHEIMPWTVNRINDPEELNSMPLIFLGMVRPLSFFDRLSNVFWTKFYQIAYDTWYDRTGRSVAIELFGPDLPPFKEIAKKQSATLLNTHYTLHGFKPHLPNVVEVGGLHISPKVRPLPEDIAKFLDEATEGVLYFNLGSMIKASTMPRGKLEEILKAIGSIPKKVIWKWETNSLPWKPDNVMVKKWLPQYDIMNHPNVECYFGHGGLLGLSEAVYAGLPMILVPMYGDQFYNSAAAETRGVAIVLRYEELSEDILKRAFNEIFNNTRYKRNMEKLSKAYKDRPASPLETAVWWSEYVGRGSALEYLRSESADQPWYQRCLLDVALFVITVSLLVSYVAYRVTKHLLLTLLCAVIRTRKMNVEEERNGKLKKRM